MAQTDTGFIQIFCLVMEYQCFSPCGVYYTFCFSADWAGQLIDTALCSVRPIPETSLSGKSMQGRPSGKVQGPYSTTG